jgi:hypothetical protein
MSYATMQDALFALDLADSELWDRPRLHPDEPTDNPNCLKSRASCAAQPSPRQRCVAPHSPSL